MLPLIVIQLFYIVIIIIVSLSCSLLPLTLTKINKKLQKRILSFANAIAGGVFLASGFVHLLYESTIMMENLGYGDFPFASVLSVAGFLTVFFIEQVVIAKMNINHDHSIDDNTDDSDSDSDSDSDVIIIDDNDNCTEIELEIIDNKNDTQYEKENGINDCNGFNDIDDHIDNNNDNTVHNKKSSISFASLALVIILSAHSFFTGFTMGTQESVQSISEVLLTILSHKWIEAFALGTNLIRNGESILTICKLTLLYSITLPLGSLIGSLIVFLLSKDVAEFVTAFATAFGSGSFIYVAIMDILCEEFKPKNDKILKFILVCFGFILISIILIVFDND